MYFKIVNKWNSYLDKIPLEKKDIYYTEEYTKLYESRDDKALCIVGEDNDYIILMPFLRRSIGNYYDFETAYGYGGPITNSYSSDWINDSIVEMIKFFKQSKYICGLIRFHPLLDNAKSICIGNCNTIFNRKTISVDLTMSINEIWARQITSKNRNMIRKAEKNGLSFKAEYDFASLSRFKELYYSTMKRLGAEEFYYFSEDYFISFCNKLRGNAFLGTVLYEDDIVAAALFMKYGEFGHYHLAGSDRDKTNMAINNYLLWKTIEELSINKVKHFNLGGGISSSLDDSLYKFKKAFSYQEKDFYIGKWIFNDDIYEDVCKEWKEKNPLLSKKYDNYLLKYRYFE